MAPSSRSVGRRACFAGYGSLTLTMAARSAPPEQMASAIGAVQTAQRFGPAIGPAIGGVLASAVGLRNAFLISSLVYVMAFNASVIREGAQRRRRTAACEGRAGQLFERAGVRELPAAHVGDLCVAGR